MKFHRSLKLFLVPTLALTTIACAGVGLDDDDDGPNRDGGVIDPNCPSVVPAATQRCDDPSCNATTGTKTFGLADLDPDTSGRWLMVSWVASDLFENEIVNVAYSKATAGGLTAAKIREKRRTALGPEAYELLLGPDRQAKLAAEHLIRENSEGSVPARGDFVPGIRARNILPPGAIKQGQNCEATAPYCTGDAICVTAADGTTRTCESNLMIKWRDQSSPGNFEMVASTVRRVGTYAAIVTDDNDTVSDADIEELSKRFEERIAPFDHAFFGEPTNSSGEDFDRNGVVILFLTSRVGDIDANLAGFFQSTDLEDPGANAASNGADILYMQPPGGNVSLHSLSGTLAHEYQHLINYYAKVINGGSSQEARWLDEAIAVFAEDASGYGSDAFKNVAAYLAAVSDTSLTGFGLIAGNENEADSIERRGMGALFIRYFFEQKGGATYGTAPGEFTDGGGIAAVRDLVQRTDTSVELFTAVSTGKTIDGWLEGFFTAVAIDDAGYPDVSCNLNATFGGPITDGYTGYQRGLKLRTSIPDADGNNIPFNGPTTNDLAAEEVPVPSNGGEIRTVSTSAMTTVGIGGPAEDYMIGFKAIPIGN